MLAVEPRTWNCRDEELRRVSIWATVGHRQRERYIVVQSRVYFVREFFTPDGFATSTITVGITSLDHEALDDSVVDLVVIVTIFCVGNKVFYCLGAFIREKVTMDLAFTCIEYNFLGPV